MRRLAALLIAMWALFWIADLAFPIFPRMAREVHLGTFLQIYGTALLACSVVVGSAALYRYGLRRARDASKK
jgi:hypothetical protein